MYPYLLLAFLLGLPIVLGIFFRVSASHIFFSVMAGELLGRYFAHDVEHQAATRLSNGQVLTGYSEAALIVVPVVLTALILRGTISHGKTILNFVPLLVTGLVFAAFVLPILPSNMQSIATSVPLGRQLLDVSDFIIGAVIVLQLVTLWILSRGEEKKKRRRKRKD